MDLPIIIICVSPLSFLGVPGVILFFNSILRANSKTTDEMLHSAAFYLGLYCLHVSYNKDARLV